MQEDVQRLYASNVRLSLEAYDFLLEKEVSEAAMKRLLATEVPVLGIGEVKAIVLEASKIPMPEAAHRAQPAGELPSREQVQKRMEAQNKASQAIAPQPEQKKDRLPVSDEMKARPSGPRQDSVKPAMEKKEEGKKEEIKIQPELQKEEKLAQDSQETKSAFVSKIPQAVQAEVARLSTFRPSAKDYSPKITIHEHRDVSGQSRCVGSVEDFVSYFRDRYEREAAILASHPSGAARLRTDQLSQNVGQDARITVMITDKRITDKGNLWLEAEDEYGQARVFISSREPAFNLAKTVLRDDVVALDGKMMPSFFVAKQITWPDIPVVRQQPKVEEDLAVAYLSDIHVGSRYFLDKAFKRFVRWLHGQEGREELAGKVKYIIVAGDVVDGIGVYPTQEKELLISDIYEQYAEFDRLVESLPDHVEVIVSPGNHDAVRRGEPQPIIPMDLIKTDVKKIGSPSSLDIEGMRHLVYHGTSLDSIISNIGGLSYAKPEGPMMEILKRRHLSPIYGENLIVPELKDYMVISDEPDVLHMGHVHKNAAMKYRGTLMINSGTFQERTDFQVRMGHIPSPGIVPVLELKSGQLSHVKFLEDRI